MLRLLEKEVLGLPPRSRVRLAEKILASIDDYADPSLETAWDSEIERRVKEIQSGAAKGISAPLKKSVAYHRLAATDFRPVNANGVASSSPKLARRCSGQHGVTSENEGNLDEVVSTG